MKLRPFLTILTVLGMAVLLFLPADIRAAATSVAPPPGQTR